VKKKILITGAEGFIGNHLIRFLSKKNYLIFGSYYKSKNLWWFRIYGRGLFGIPTKSDWIPFSIRYKHRKTIKLFGHYIGILKKEK
jgi:nucleoside-diphosphate-sugar epimerase